MTSFRSVLALIVGLNFDCEDILSMAVEGLGIEH